LALGRDAEVTGLAAGMDGEGWLVGGMRSTPLQNRVTPAGEIVSDPGRGLLMGNRGCLHGPDRELGVARWRSKLWICCVLAWKDVQRDPMPPGRWTALFFLDEATALAAGIARAGTAVGWSFFPSARRGAVRAGWRGARGPARWTRGCTPSGSMRARGAS